jgi:methionine aminopeptidase
VDSQRADFAVAKKLQEERTIYEYPVLVEASGMPIAQAEHTILITGHHMFI